MTQEPIAIIGMACRFPGAADLASYWENILGCVDAVGEPEPGWGAERYRADGRITTSRGGYLRDLFRFDPSAFGIMPRALDGGEPDQFLALQVAREALVDAGYERDTDHRSTGIILGHSTYLHRGNASVVQHGIVLDQTLDLIRSLMPELDAERLDTLRTWLQERLPSFSADMAPGLVPNVMTGRIANRLDLQGPNYLIDAACASSLLAVGAAIDELRSGRSDLMLAGGVNASLPAEVAMVFTQLGALATNGRLRPFDANASGTLLGEGLGIVVLKRLEDARRDGDRIYARVLAVGQSSDGRATGLLAPRLEGEILAIQRAVQQSGIDPFDIGLVEAHGTGIPLGDRTEVQALATVLGERRRRLAGCALGSVKSMISHTIPAAGVAGMIKTALALHHRILPPTLCEDVNDELRLEETPLYVNTRARPWIQGAGRDRIAGIDAFGFGGINTHAVLSADHEAELDTRMAWPYELFLFAEPSREALLQSLKALQRQLDDVNQQQPLGWLAFRVAERRNSGPYRLALVATDRSDLARKLTQAETRIRDPERLRMQSRSGIFFSAEPLSGQLALLFPGEGSQYQGMLEDLALHFPVVRQAIDAWDAAAPTERPFRPGEVLYPPPTGLRKTDAEALSEALFGLELGSESMFFAGKALHALLQEFAIEADAIAGHSSGEHAALLASGALAPMEGPDLARLVRELNGLYQTLAASDLVATGALLAVGAVPRTRVLELVDQSGGKLHLALDNCHHQAVVFGPDAEVDALAATLRAEGGLCQRLPLDRAYHTPLFQPVASRVEEFYRQLPIHGPRIPLYSCADAARFPDDPDAIRKRAAAQWARRVRFVETVEHLYTEGVRVFLEVGPGSTLTGFVGDILRERPHAAIAMDQRQRHGLDALLQALGRLFVLGRSFDTRPLFRRRGLREDQFSGATSNVAPGLRLDNTLPFIACSAADLAPWRQAVSSSRTDTVAHAVRLPESSRHSEPGTWASAHDTMPTPPLLSHFVLETPDQVFAEAELSVATHRFLRHHILYAREVSELHPELHGLAVMPLAVSLELLAECASLLAPGTSLQAFEDVRAYDWIAFDRGWRQLAVRAELIEAGQNLRIAVAIHDSTDPRQPRLLDAIAVFGAPQTITRSLPALREPRPSAWSDAELYTTGMFHGPLFRPVRHLQAWDSDGMDADLADCSLEGFVDDTTSSNAFQLNPVLLDGIGHLTAFWIAQQYGTDFSSFPSSIQRIRFAGPATRNTDGGTLSGRLRFLEDGRFLEGRFEAVDATGQALLSVEGWRDRFFSVPHAFYSARTAPRTGWYGNEVAVSRCPSGALGAALRLPTFPTGFLEDAGQIWARVLAHTVLDPEERALWLDGIAGTPGAQVWLLRNLAIKEAVRLWLARHAERLPYPADVSVRVDAQGRTCAWGWWEDQLAAPLQIALSEDAGGWVAEVWNGVYPDAESQPYE